MFKNLVKRSSFQKIIVGDNAPVTLLIEGDEVYVHAYPDPEGLSPDAGGVVIGRQTDREFLKMQYDRIFDEIFPGIETTGKRVDLSKRLAYDGSTLALESGETGVNLLCGFSDNVTFSIAGTPNGVAHVVIETIHYEPRR
ncbi:hypothetical protein [Spirosoma areae]